MALKRDCGTCAHNANGWACDKCKDHDKWELKEGDVDRACENCKYRDLSSLQEPCKYCFTVNDEGSVSHPTAWESKDEAMDVSRPVTCAYKFKTMDGSCAALAHAICMHYKNKYPDDMEGALIVLEEFAEHIDSFVRAKRKLLEREKTYLEKEG